MLLNNSFFTIMQLMARSTGTTWITMSLIKEFCLISIHINLKILCHIQIHNNNKKNTSRLTVYNINVKIPSRLLYLLSFSCAAYGACQTHFAYRMITSYIPGSREQTCAWEVTRARQMINMVIELITFLKWEINLWVQMSYIEQMNNHSIIHHCQFPPFYLDCITVQYILGVLQQFLKDEILCCNRPNVFAVGPSVSVVLIHTIAIFSY